MMTIQVQTRIKCPLNSDPDSPVEYRTVVFHRDGLISASSHGPRGGLTHNISAEVRKLIVAVSMGFKIVPVQHSSAITFAALLSGGIPRAGARGATTTAELGAWLPPYIRWEENKLVKALLRAEAETIARCVDNPVQLVDLLTNQLSTDISVTRRQRRQTRAMDTKYVTVDDSKSDKLAAAS